MRGRWRHTSSCRYWLLRGVSCRLVTPESPWCHADINAPARHVFNKFRRRTWISTTCMSQHRRFVAAAVLNKSMLLYTPVLFCSLAEHEPRIGHNMDVLSPFISVLYHSDWLPRLVGWLVDWSLAALSTLFHGDSCPRIDVVHPGRAWSSSPACTWNCSLHYLFLQATALFPHCVTIVC